MVAIIPEMRRCGRKQCLCSSKSSKRHVSCAFKDSPVSSQSLESRPHHFLQLPFTHVVERSCFIRVFNALFRRCCGWDKFFVRLLVNRHTPTSLLCSSLFPICNRTTIVQHHLSVIPTSQNRSFDPVTRTPEAAYQPLITQHHHIPHPIRVLALAGIE